MSFAFRFLACNHEKTKCIAISPEEYRDKPPWAQLWWGCCWTGGRRDSPDDGEDHDDDYGGGGNGDWDDDDVDNDDDQEFAKLLLDRRVERSPELWFCSKVNLDIFMVVKIDSSDFKAVRNLIHVCTISVKRKGVRFRKYTYFFIVVTGYFFGLKPNETAKVSFL